MRGNGYEPEEVMSNNTVLMKILKRDLKKKKL